jgi:hypothetical protein
MAQIIITVTKGKDNKGNDVTECTPHNVSLSIAAGDTAVWASFEGNVKVMLAPGTAALLNGGPWTATQGKVSNAATISTTATPGRFCNVIAELTLPGATAPIGEGGPIMCFDA